MNNRLIIILCALMFVAACAGMPAGSQDTYVPGGDDANITRTGNPNPVPVPTPTSNAKPESLRDVTAKMLEQGPWKGSIATTRGPETQYVATYEDGLVTVEMENGTSWQTPMEIDEDGTGFTTDDDVPYAISVKPRESSTKYPLDVQLVDKENDAFSRAFMIPGAELGADTTLAKTGFDAPYFFVNYVSARDIKGNLTGEKLYDSCSEDGSVLIERVEVEISGRIYNGTNPVPCACENGKCIDDISDRPFLFTPTTVFDILMKTHDVLDKAIESNAEIFRTNPVVIPMGNL